MEAISATDFLEDDRDDERPGSGNSFSGSEDGMVRSKIIIQSSTRNTELVPNHLRISRSVCTT